MGSGWASEVGTTASQKTQGNKGLIYVEDRVLYSHVWPVTGKWMHNRNSVSYVNYTAIKLNNKIEPVLATFGAYHRALDGQQLNNDINCAVKVKYTILWEYMVGEHLWVWEIREVFPREVMLSWEEREEWTRWMGEGKDASGGGTIWQRPWGRKARGPLERRKKANMAGVSMCQMRPGKEAGLDHVRLYRPRKAVESLS